MKLHLRLFTAAAALVLFCGMLPVLPVSAEAQSGTIGDGITWELDDAGLLKITGTGKMPNYGFGDSPFYKLENDIQAIEISEGITEIGDHVFTWCKNVPEIYVPDTVTRIGAGAFYHCSAMKTIHLPVNLAAINSETFTDCRALKEITIPETVAYIGALAFGRCEALTSIDIPASVTSLGHSAFDDCVSLENIKLTENITEMGSYVFSDTPWLAALEAKDPLVIINGIVVTGKKCVGEVVIPDTVHAITSQAFAGAGNVTGVKLPPTVTEILYSTFWESGLKEITLPETVTRIDEDAFSDCGKLEKITILCPFCEIHESKDTISHDTEIIGYANSTAQQYAKTNFRTFTSLGDAPEYEKGDINRDGACSLADLVLLQKYLIGEETLSAAWGYLADFDENQKINAKDLTLMKRKLLGQTDTNYVEPEFRNEYGAEMIVVADSVSLYLGPSTDYPAAATIPQYAIIEELGYTDSVPEWIFTEYEGQYGWVHTVDPETGAAAVRYNVMPAKPVIYLYPERETDVHVELELTEAELATTYPKYQNGWDVTAYPDGTLLNKADGSHHRYLFWDAVNCRTRFDFSEGFCIAGCDTERFLKETLTEIGLTEDERNEFIVYWLPRMEHNAYNFIAFQGAAYTDTAKLSITPAPDSLLRVFMTYVPLEEAVEAKPQTFVPFERNGFTVVEWGGAEL